MAALPRAIGRRDGGLRGEAARLTGLAALALVILPIVAVAWRGRAIALSSADGAALRFTLLQASLSAVISVLLAIPVAKALARRRFPGRRFFITLMGAPFLLPVIVAVMGLLTIFGRAGVMNDLLAFLGLPRLTIYGLSGVLLAHVFLNLPLAVRMILQGWQAIPEERFRLAESLSLGPAEIARYLERPMLREVLPGALATIFAVCLTSFAVALMLGGGPAATTLELAIYQAMRFDFDLGHAAGLALLQAVVGGVAAVLAWRLTQVSGFGSGMDRPIVLGAPGGWRRLADAVWLVLTGLFLALPLLAVILRGIGGLADLSPAVWWAAGRSVTVALISTALALTLSLSLALGVAARPRRWMEMAALLPLAASGLVLGTGLFLLVQAFVRPSQIALAVTVLVNALSALPFAFRLLLPEARALEANYAQLAASLGLRGWARLRLLTLPRLARPIGFAAGLSAALSMGDLGVIALFAEGQGATLPLMVQQLASAYRNDSAAGAALLLVTASFILFWIFDAGGRRAASRQD